MSELLEQEFNEHLTNTFISKRIMITCEETDSGSNEYEYEYEYIRWTLSVATY